MSEHTHSEHCYSEGDRVRVFPQSRNLKGPTGRVGTIKKVLRGGVLDGAVYVVLDGDPEDETIGLGPDAIQPVVNDKGAGRRPDGR